MKIVHGSDWHGNWRKLPPADLYILTGDMLPNFHVSHSKDAEAQTKWCEGWRWSVDEPGFRSCFGSPDAPVVIVRGNHDFYDIGRHFGDNCFEIDDDTTRFAIINGVKIGGTRGVPVIDRPGGRWNDQFDDAEFERRLNLIPIDIDILVTHSPPYQILDYVAIPLFDFNGRISGEGIRLGSLAVRRFVDNCDNLKLHVFGHIHEEPGVFTDAAGVTFSNAATRYNEIDI